MLNNKMRNEEIKMKKYSKRVIALGMSVGLMCIGITGCGKEEAPVEKTVDMQKFQEEMLAADTTLPEMKEVSSKDENADLNFTALSDIDYDMVEDYFYCYAADGDVQEIAVIALKNEKNSAETMKSLHEHVDNRIGTLQEYSPEKVELAKKAVITNEGRYVTLIIGEKTGLVQNVFKDYLAEE